MKNLLTILCVLAAYCLFAQDYKLIYYKGDVTIAGQKLATNALIKNDAVVTIGNNAEALFTNNNKEVVHLNKPGGYTVRNFAAYVKPKSSLSGYYLNYVVNAATHHEADLEKHVTENLKNVGGVSRGRRRFLNFPVVPTIVLDSNVILKWNGSYNSVYSWTLTENTGNPWRVADGRLTNATTITLNFIELGASWGKDYDWKLNDMDSQAEADAHIHLAQPSDAEAITDTIIMLSANPDMPEPVRYATAGAFAEQKQCYLVADFFYSQAVEKAPDNELIKQLYSSFRKNIYGE